MGYNILVVDDSDIIRSVIKKSLDMSGLQIGVLHDAANGVEALEVLDKEWVDIVFSDINMPEMNGLELVEKMSADEAFNQIPVVIISTERSQARIDSLMRRGVRGYINKPFTPEQLRDIVLEVLKGEGEASHE